MSSWAAAFTLDVLVLALEIQRQGLCGCTAAYTLDVLGLALGNSVAEVLRLVCRLHAGCAGAGTWDVGRAEDSLA